MVVRFTWCGIRPDPASASAGIARAGQYAVPIQCVFADDVGEAGSSLIAGVCADDLADGAGQGLAGAAGYVVVNTRLGLHHGPGSYVILSDQPC